jgi:hypothetical protein
MCLQPKDAWTQRWNNEKPAGPGQSLRGRTGSIYDSDNACAHAQIMAKLVCYQYDLIHRNSTCRTTPVGSA